MTRYRWDALVKAMGGSERDATIALRLSGSTARRLRSEGLDADQADRLAVRAGFTPYEVWPEMLDEAVAEVERKCAADWCDEPFVPYRPQNLYCSRRCKRRAERQRAMERPDGRRRHREANRRYYRECRDSRRARRQEVQEEGRQDRLQGREPATTSGRSDGTQEDRRSVPAGAEDVRARIETARPECAGSSA